MIYAAWMHLGAGSTGRPWRDTFLVRVFLGGERRGTAGKVKLILPPVSCGEGRCNCKRHHSFYSHFGIHLFYLLSVGT